MSRLCPWAWCGTNTPGADLCDLCALTAERDRLAQELASATMACRVAVTQSDRLREQNAAQAEQLQELREALGAILNDGRPIPWARCAAIADAALSRTEADG